jgi:hypothetical protein
LLAGIATVLTLERDRLWQRQPVSQGMFPVSNGHLGIALARLRQREQQLLLETTDTPRASSGNRPKPASEIKSLTLLRHKLQRQRSGNASA